MSDPIPDNHETVLWSGSVSQWHYAGKWLFILVLLVVLSGTFLMKIPVDVAILIAGRGALGLAAIVIFAWIRLDRVSRRYTVTDKRVSVEFGIISKQSNELRVQDIRSINLTTTGLSGMLGIGRLEFSSAASDDADVVFWNTPNVEKIRDMVRGLQA